MHSSMENFEVNLSSFPACTSLFTKSTSKDNWHSDRGSRQKAYFQSGKNCKDRKGNGTINYHPRELQKISDVMDAFDFIDIWRLKHPKLTRYTWRRQTSTLYWFLYIILHDKQSNSINKLRSDHLYRVQICNWRKQTWIWILEM